MMTLQRAADGVEPVPPDNISKEMEGPVPPGPNALRHHENCWESKLIR